MMDETDIVTGLLRGYAKRKHDTYSTGDTNIAPTSAVSAVALDRTMCELTNESESYGRPEGRAQDSRQRFVRLALTLGRLSLDRFRTMSERMSILGPWSI